MTSLETVRFVGGFAMAGSVSPAQYQSAGADPVAAFAPHVIRHMNDDHADSLAAIVKHYLQVPCFGAELVGMDKLGMTVSVIISKECVYVVVSILLICMISILVFIYT